MRAYARSQVRGGGLGGEPQNPPRKHPPGRARSYHKTGLYALKRLAKDEAAWLRGLGSVGMALREWRSALVQDLGGEAAISAQQRAIVEMCSKTYLILSSIDRWMLSQPSLINKKRRVLFGIVTQRQQLADSLARHLQTLGLERRPTKVPTLSDYVHGKYGAPAPPDPAEAPTETGTSE
jgi:hypothetical protein